LTSFFQEQENHDTTRDEIEEEEENDEKEEMEKVKFSAGS